MKRIAFVGAVGAGKTTLFNALRGNYSLARKTQAVEFNDHGDIDTPGEYFSHPRWYHALITTLQDVDTLIYVHAANDKESRLPAGLLDVGTVNDISPLSAKRTCRMPTSPLRGSCFARLDSGSRFSSSTATTRKACGSWWIIWRLSVNRRKRQVKKLITANDIRAAHARGEQAMSVVLRASIITPEAREVAELLGFTITECDESVPASTSAQACKSESQRIREAIIAQLPEGQFTESLVGAVDGKSAQGKAVVGTGDDAAELYLRHG
ncbi:Ethanolamine utilization protein eutQ [Salmonella enterica subsp. enterica]|nr:Ethanolamine utilization protein eutQ [Salmonella enterica subsp. enterica]